ncbi:hypothetical protein EDB84DRAFT_1439710 [Lactarius hengduanensis]|nr:hypothetical protein EDB84DRAFT_1439710 [Lactarius hengduanensis]
MLGDTLTARNINKLTTTMIGHNNNTSTIVFVTGNPVWVLAGCTGWRVGTAGQIDGPKMNAVLLYKEYYFVAVAAAVVAVVAINLKIAIVAATSLPSSRRHRCVIAVVAAVVAVVAVLSPLSLPLLLLYLSSRLELQPSAASPSLRALPGPKAIVVGVPQALHLRLALVWRWWFGSGLANHLIDCHAAAPRATNRHHPGLCHRQRQDTANDDHHKDNSDSDKNDKVISATTRRPERHKSHDDLADGHQPPPPPPLLPGPCHRPQQEDVDTDNNNNNSNEDNKDNESNTTKTFQNEGCSELPKTRETRHTGAGSERVPDVVPVPVPVKPIPGCNHNDGRNNNVSIVFVTGNLYGYLRVAWVCGLAQQYEARCVVIAPRCRCITIAVCCVVTVVVAVFAAIFVIAIVAVVTAVIGVITAVATVSLPSLLPFVAAVVVVESRICSPLAIAPAAALNCMRYHRHHRPAIDNSKTMLTTTTTKTTTIATTTTTTGQHDDLDSHQPLLPPLPPGPCYRQQQDDLNNKYDDDDDVNDSDTDDDDDDATRKQQDTSHTATRTRQQALRWAF